MKESRHTCYTSFHCLDCRNQFKCKREKEMKRDEREKAYKEDKVPECELCNVKHFRCLTKKCTMCCELNKCRTYPCQYCIDNNIECKYSIIKSKEEFEKFKEKNMSAFIGQLELSKEGVCHVQAYCQFKKKVLMANIKKMFGDNSISFPDIMR
ncbi:5620_t:CDS:1, partial [Cetraspora pellucida]